MRRRRDGAGGAPSSGSRVSPLPIAPCHAGRRRSTVLRTAVPFPDHRLSNSAFLASTRSASSRSCACIAFPMVRRETPHLAHGAGGASSYRSVPGLVRALGRPRRPPGSCTTSLSVERSVPRHARPIRPAFDSHLSDLLRAPQAMRMSLRSIESGGHGIRTAPERADGRAPARGEPVAAGKPCSVDSGDGALRHVNVGSLVARRTCSARAREIMDPENTNRVTDDRLTHCSGQGGPTRTPVA
jgi:hypothetical protein